MSSRRLDRKLLRPGAKGWTIAAIGVSCAMAVGPWVHEAQGQNPAPQETAPSGAPALPAKVNNPAGMSIQIMPVAEIKLGTKIFVKVSTKKPGYLILVDVDANGKVTQIYPNIHSMTIPGGATENTNFLKSNMTVSVPDPSNPFAHFEFVAEPPLGKGMIIALLSAQPVHVVDLPDVPQELLGSGEEMSFLYDAASALRIASHEATAPLADPRWSFAAKPYSIEN